MMEWISNWAESIIIAVIIAAIIQMILPEGNSKKYIKVVIGIYILFTIISPIISNFSPNSLAVSNVLDIEQYIEEIKEKEKSQNILQTENAASIRDIYIGNLKADMQTKLKGKGYEVTSIDLDVGYDDNYTLNKITLSAEKVKDNDSNEEEEESNSNETINTQVQNINEINIQISNTESSNQVSNTNKQTEKNESISSSNKKKIKEYLSSVYEINEKNILIN